MASTTTSADPVHPVERASLVVGGRQTLAGMIDVSLPALYQWVSGARPIPARKCVAIEQATGGAVTRRELRPHDWAAIWPELSEAKAEG